MYFTALFEKFVLNIPLVGHPGTGPGIYGFSYTDKLWKDYVNAIHSIRLGTHDTWKNCSKSCVYAQRSYKSLNLQVNLKNFSIEKVICWM